MTVRDAKRDDAPAVACLLGELGYPADEDEARAHIRRFSGDPSTRLQVAVDGSDDRPVGLVATHLVPRLDRDLRTCRVTELVVDPSWRRAGVGRALIEAAKAEARRHGAVRLDLTSGNWREEAHEFYPDAGFERVGVGYLLRLRPEE